MADIRKIALIGNPNSGKTSVFNRLTGLRQKVGNYPGVTVDKRSGVVVLPNGKSAELIDFPGTYGLSPKSLDEKVVQSALLNPEGSLPDLLVSVVDATNLERNLVLTTQLIDLGFPVVLALNQTDLLARFGLTINTDKLSEKLGIPVVSVSAKTGDGLTELKALMAQDQTPKPKTFLDPLNYASATLKDFQSNFGNEASNYLSFNQLVGYQNVFNPEKRTEVDQLIRRHNFSPEKEAIAEINARFGKVKQLITEVQHQKSDAVRKSEKIDRWVTHPVFGLVIFFLVFFMLFQSIFTFSQLPMDAISMGMEQLGSWVGSLMPEGWLRSLVVDGLIAGIGGVVIFIPQIAILFGLLNLLEESGYLARVSFMMDGVLKQFGMNGKSVVPLVSGFACAIPAMMSARAIENQKDRFITLFITPLMSCSARLPVYVFLVSFIAPDTFIWGIINTQGLVMLGLYLLGIMVSLLVALVIHKLSKIKSNGLFILELPNYKVPSFKNALAVMWNKGKVFTLQAGKVILIASLVLWFLANTGGGAEVKAIETQLLQENLTDADFQRQLSSEKLRHSYLGQMGRAIEPVIAPLGFDWKIGIALLSSFAAREVFVGAMATIYSVEETVEGKGGLLSIHFSFATAFSLLMFYVFALQCLSTVAIARQELGSWKWAVVQWLVFTGIAYVASLVTYQILS